jgi:hypothetical protein
MTTSFIHGTPMLPKSDENHIVYLVACEVAIYLAFANDITTKVCFLLFKLITPFPNKKT